MKLPSLRAWVFALKAFAAGALALYIALWIDLPRPYWAVTTVYVVAQPFAGPTLSKALYRLCGTALGALGAVLIVPNLSGSPELLALGMSLWTACCLFLALRDRRPHNYIFMLAGYTAPIVGFPAVDDPGSIFLTAISRVEEIGLGIICAGVVGSLVFPMSIAGAFGERVRVWLGHSRTWAQEVLGGAAQTATRASLAADVIDIDMFAAHLGFDPASPGRARRRAEMLRSRMLLLLPLTASIASRIRALGPQGMTDELGRAVNAVRSWLANGAPEPGAPALRDAIASAAPPLGEDAAWHDLLRANLAVRLRNLVDLQVDCAVLRRHIMGSPGRLRLAVPDVDGTPDAAARHVDMGLAVRSSLAAVLAMLLGSAFWIATAWPDGASVPEIAGVMCCFFAGLDNPVGPQLSFGKWAAVSVAVSAAYVFAILPLVTQYETLILVLAPVFIVAGLVAFNPANAIIGLAVAANLPALIGLQSRYSADFPAFANGGLALLGGVWCAALTTAVCRVVQPAWTRRRLLRASWLAVARAAEERGHGDRAIFASLMMDRAGQLAARLATGDTWPDMMATIRIGLNVVDLRRARRPLPPSARRRLDAVLDGLAAEYRARAGSCRFERQRLQPEVLDTALAEATLLPPSTTRDDMLLGLVGIRLGLFPQVPGYVSPMSHTVPVLVAAE